MSLNKAQSIVITLLNVLIVALVAVILFLPNFLNSRADEPASGDVVNPPIEDDPPPEENLHDKYRDAASGKVDGIIRETRLMGNGDEDVVRVFFRDGVAFIFGNSTVKGLDFDEYGGFLCVVNGAGKILSFTYFGGNITAVCIMPGGYCVAAGSSLYFVDYLGAKKKIAAIEGACKWLSPENFGIAAVTQPSSTSLLYTEFAQNGDEYIKAHSTRIESGFNLEFFACYTFYGSKKMIAARTYRLPLYDSIGFFTFEPGGSSQDYYHGNSAELSIKPYAVTPYANGYFSVVSRNGVAAILSFDDGFSSYSVSNLGFSFSDAALNFVGGKYYASFARGDGAVTYSLDEHLSRTRVDFLDGILPQCATKLPSGEAIFGGKVYGMGGKSGNALSFASTDKDSVTFDITDGTVHAMEYTDSGVIAVVSASGGDALSAPTSGKDIYVLLLDNF
ncbi:MAG: hypothetical protein J1G04_04090 [Clostridiales bacterium]|nr:hypothetical protein [Clostridiales bacterium]